VFEFINNHQGNMSVNQYAFKFGQLSRYSPTMIADPRARISNFVSSVSDMLVKEYRTAMLIYDMDISHLMFHAQQLEEKKLKERSREAKRERTGDGNFSHSRSDGHSRSKFCKRLSDQGFSNSTPKFNKDGMFNPVPQREKCGRSSFSMSTRAMYGRKHEGKCFSSMNGCFSCGKSGHQRSDCSSLTGKGREGKQAMPSISGSNSPKLN